MRGSLFGCRGCGLRFGERKMLRDFDRDCGGDVGQRAGACRKSHYTEGKMETVAELDRITRNPAVMGGKPCIRGMRVTAGTLVGLIASGHSYEAILAAYPYLEEEDIRQALAYSAWRIEEIEIPLPAA